MKNIDERLLLEHVRRINSIIQNTRSTENKKNIFDVGYEETTKSEELNESINQIIDLINYDRTNVLLESSSETTKIHKMANLLYPDEMYSLSSEGESLTNSGIFAGRDDEIGSENNKKFQNYASKLATPREWMTIFPYSMSKYYDPSFKKYPELYTKWKGRNAKDAEMSMISNAWDSKVNFKSFDKIDFSKTSDNSNIPGLRVSDEISASKKYAEELSKTKEDMRQKSIWEDPDFVKNWSGEYDSLFYEMMFPPTFYKRLAYEAASEGYKHTPQWFKDWWEKTATPFIQDYGWIPAVVLGLGSVIALICGAPVLAFGLGVASVFLDVLEIITYIQQDDPFMAGLCMVFLVIPGDAILRVVGGKRYMRQAADFLAEWALGPNARKGTKEMFKEAGHDLFGPIIQIGTNVKLYFKAMKKMIRASLVSLITTLRIKGLCKLIVWLISKGYLLVKFLVKTVFQMGTLAVTWGALCYYLGIPLPWQKGEQELSPKKYDDPSIFIYQWLNYPVTPNDFPLEKEKIGETNDIRIKIIQLTLDVLGYSQIYESDLSHLSYADRSYGIPKNDEERKKRCSTMFASGDIVGLKSDPSCKDYVGYFDPTKKTGIKLKPNYDISTKNTIKNIDKTKKDALGFNKDFGLKFDVQNKNLSTGLDYYEKPTATGGLNLGFTPGKITPKLGYWDNEFDKMILVFQKRNNLKIENNITKEFIEKLKEFFTEDEVRQKAIKYSGEQLKKEFDLFYGEDYSKSLTKEFIDNRTDETINKIKEAEKNNADLRQGIYDSIAPTIDVISDVDEAQKIIDQINGFAKDNKLDTLNTPVTIYVPLED
jgi:hypothetical protein